MVCEEMPGEAQRRDDEEERKQIIKKSEKNPVFGKQENGHMDDMKDQIHPMTRADFDGIQSMRME